MSSNNDFENEIDLKNIFDSLIRNKISILIITLISTAFTYSYWSSLKPIWSGNFNILINKQNDPKSASESLSSITSLISKSKVNNDSETQRLLLSSPLILNSVFKDVIDYRKENKLNTDLTFKKWISTIKIDYENGSNILDINHENSDKVLLLRTLELIADKYKEYSKREQIKNIAKTKDYLSSQSKLMLKRASDSKKLLDKFSIENNLGNIEGFISFQEIERNVTFTPASEGIKKYPGSRFESQFSLLKQKETDFFNLSQHLKPNSETLKSLKKDIQFLKESLKRPTEILIRYEELADESFRNTALLNEVQTSLELIKLEEVKTPDPWQLISDPLIGNRPISFSKKKKLQYSFFISLIIGCVLVNLKEISSGVIYSKSPFDAKLKVKYLETINRSQNELSLKIVDNLIKTHNDYSKDKVIGFVNYKSKVEIGFIEESLIKNPNLLFLDINDQKLEGCDQIYLIFEKGKFTLENLSHINKYINLYKEKFVGWFYIS